MITAGECTATKGLTVVGTTLTRRPLSDRVNTGSPATNIRGWTLTEIPDGFRPPTSRPTPLMQETRDAPTRTKFAQSLTEARSVGEPISANISTNKTGLFDADATLASQNRSPVCARQLDAYRVWEYCFIGMTTVEHLVRQDAQMDRPNTPHHMYHQGSKPLTRKR